MAVEITNITILKPYNPTPRPDDDLVPLTIFDLATFDHSVPFIYAFRGPLVPSNNALVDGLRNVLPLYPHLTGRKAVDGHGNLCIALNGAGARVVEARVHATLEEKLPLEETSKLADLYPKLLEGAEELFQVQLNRYTCGGLVIGIAIHHRAADGQSMSHFLVAWADIVRNPSAAPRPPCLDRAATCIPRSPPKCEFNHMETEFKVDPTSAPTDPRPAPKIVNIVLHFSPEKISDLKSKVPDRSSTFSNLLAHLWKKLTIVRGVKDDEPTRVRIAVDGRARLRPPVRTDFFGNLVLWAFPKMRAGELVRASHADIVRVIRDAVSRVDDGYFQSFVNFGASVDSRDLVRSSTAPKLWSSLSPDLEVDSWTGFKFHELDFGGGLPCAFIPPDLPVEGLMVFVPSCKSKGGGVDVFLALLEDHVGHFKAVCYDMP